MQKILFANLVLLSIALAGQSIPVRALPAEQGSLSNSTSCGEKYKVRRGDSMNKIAKRCGLTLSALVMANPQIKNPSRIYTGQTLYFPHKAEPVNAESPTLVIRPEADRLTTEQIQQLGIQRDSPERWIDVDLSSQTVSAYQGHQAARTFLVSTGTWRYPTVTGRFQVLTKHEKVRMQGPGYDLKDVPYTMFFHKDYGLHGTYWHDNFGTPMSHGCVNMATEDALWLFGFAEVGTMVNVHH